MNSGNTPINIRQSILWGFGGAFLHRLLLQLWMMGTWLAVGRFFAEIPDFQTPVEAGLPTLAAPWDILLGMWRRWDAIHYLRLAQDGYQLADSGTSVFPPLTSWSIGVMDSLLPGGVDIAGAVFGTLAFGCALTLLHMLSQLLAPGEEGEALAGWAIVVYALLPLGHFLTAPMSDGLFLALTIGSIYFGLRESWWIAALLGFLATVTRTQGVLLVIPLISLIVKQAWQLPSRQPTRRVVEILRHGWKLALIPLGALLFLLFRQSLGFPALSTIYETISYRIFVNPLEGLWLNLRFMLNAPLDVDAWGIVISLVLMAFFLKRNKTRLWPLSLYCIIMIALFLTPINYAYGTDIITNTQSYGRYALALFPLGLLTADILRCSGRMLRLGVVLVLILGLLSLSARHTLGLLGP